MSVSTDVMPGTVRQGLNGNDIKTLGIASLGGALEFYDFIIFAYFAVVMGKIFFPPDVPEWMGLVQTFGIFAAGYLARPLGGIIMAHFGDLLGRKKMFMLSIFLMALPTLGMGLLPTYATLGIGAPMLLLLLRMIQGAAIGGEVPGAWVFVAEHVPKRHVGLACGTLTAGLTIGILLGAIVATIVNKSYTPEEVQQFGWRIPFILGGIFGLLSVYLRRWLTETPVFEALAQQKKLSQELPLKKVIREHRAGTVVSILLTWVLSACIVVVILMTPTFLQKMYSVSTTDALQANSLATIGLAIGCIFYGMMADRIGTGRTLIIGSIFLGIAVWCFYAGIRQYPHYLYPLYALTGFCVGIVGIVSFVMVQAFPAVVRFSGLSFAYNLSYAIFGWLTLTFVPIILPKLPMVPAIYVSILAVLGMATGVYMCRAGWSHKD